MLVGVIPREARHGWLPLAQQVRELTGEGLVGRQILDQVHVAVVIVLHTSTSCTLYGNSPTWLKLLFTITRGIH